MIDYKDWAPHVELLANSDYRAQLLPYAEMAGKELDELINETVLIVRKRDDLEFKSMRRLRAYCVIVAKGIALQQYHEKKKTAYPGDGYDIEPYPADGGDGVEELTGYPAAGEPDDENDPFFETQDDAFIRGFTMRPLSYEKLKANFIKKFGCVNVFIEQELRIAADRFDTESAFGEKDILDVVREHVEKTHPDPIFYRRGLKLGLWNTVAGYVRFHDDGHEKLVKASVDQMYADMKARERYIINRIGNKLT